MIKDTRPITRIAPVYMARFRIRAAVAAEPEIPSCIIRSMQAG
ncbi:hypothetical protein EVA_16457 [gut metagenome]|uniref:Uncharacterized protein n=1 Tax=gut metagenome TaxID=749906 RepID=J9FKK7_9ZZZZ